MEKYKREPKYYNDNPQIVYFSMENRRLIISKLDHIYTVKATGERKISMAEVTGYEELTSFADLRNFVMDLRFPTPQTSKMESYGWTPTLFMLSDHIFPGRGGQPYTVHGRWRSGAAERSKPLPVARRSPFLGPFAALFCSRSGFKMLFCLNLMRCASVAGELGLEPRTTVPKTAVLPLHHSPAGPARHALADVFGEARG
jgi:hypothetical protein